ncbi:MAG TPA: TadE family protein [Actinomycetes bacterium]|nr:TadE family protein [Actinomycetes bacterium]
MTDVANLGSRGHRYRADRLSCLNRTNRYSRPRLAAQAGQSIYNDRKCEDGSAIIEFCYLAVLLMAPLVYVVLIVFDVQRAGYAVTQATREAARAFVTTDQSADAEERAYAAAYLALRDHGLRLTSGELRISCELSPCLRPGNRVSVRIDTTVPLPFVPAIFDGVAPASIAIHGAHEELVDVYRSAGP